PGVTCSSITQAQCKDPKWREIIARDCPNVCGFCKDGNKLYENILAQGSSLTFYNSSGGCVDAAIECANDKSICRNIDMQAFTMANCKKTCGYCDNASTSYPGGYSNQPGGACVDSSSKCASWKENGFCQSTFYTVTQKMQSCAKTCGFC
ncbi:shTK domain protein, partial [Teladorsagia circumcincta]